MATQRVTDGQIQLQSPGRSLFILLALVLFAEARIGLAREPHLVKDISPMAESSYPQGFTAWGDRLVFAARAELWVSDGTAEGTLPLRELVGQSPSWRTAREELVGWRRERLPEAVPPVVPVAGRLFFMADDGEHGWEPWVTDGTPGGTVLLRDLYSGPEGVRILTSRAVADKLFFIPSYDDGTYHRELWATDGTSEGTFFLTDHAQRNDHDLRRDLSFGDTAVFGGRLLFEGYDPEHGFELWASDGTPGGTSLLVDLRPGPESSRFSWSEDDALPAPTQPIVLGGRSVFTADDGEHGRELFVTDGTAGGTHLLGDLRPGPEGSDPANFSVAGGLVFFETEGVIAPPPFNGGEGAKELWRTDGTRDGTIPFRELIDRPNDWWGVAPVRGALGRFFFRAKESAYPWELWTSDGTPEGTLPVRELAGQRFLWVPLFSSLKQVGDRVFFQAVEDRGALDPEDWELWVSDGTAAGTRFLRSFTPLGFYPQYLLDGRFSSSLLDVGGLLVFVANHEEYGLELWRSDGTAEGTHLLADTWPGPTSGYGGRFSLEEGRLFFCGRDVNGGDRLWTTDGTRESTFSLEGTVPGEGLSVGSVYWWGFGGDMVNSYDPPFLRIANRLFFSADDGTHGYELWAVPLGDRPPFRRGDSDGDGEVNLTDAIGILDWLFTGTSTPGCVAAANVNGDGQVDVSDPLYLLGFLFLGGTAPYEPFPDCGSSGLYADEELGCEAPPRDCQ